MNNILDILTILSILGCGIIGGIFFAFSTFIMQALKRLSHAQGIEAMQKINITVLTSWFLGIFMGTAAICLVIAVSTYWTWGKSGTYFLLIGSIFYIVGTFLVTGICNVPLNNRLEGMEPTSDEASDFWTDVYLTKWVFWNHVRTIAAILGALTLIIALL